jgi:aminoglycoside 3-N-acetyltransferase I
MSSSGLFSIRRLTPGDVALMEAMMAMLGDAFDEVDTYTAARPSREYLGRLLGAKHFIALAALKEDTVVGGLAAYELQKFERQRSEIYIYDLAVAAVHRREGIATALIDRLKTIAANLGAHVIFVQADRAGTPAISLYRKLCACSEVLHFDIEIARR